MLLAVWQFGADNEGSSYHVIVSGIVNGVSRSNDGRKQSAPRQHPQYQALCRPAFRG